MAARQLISIFGWGLIVFAAWVLFGGPYLPMCLGGVGGSQAACVEAWYATHPRPPLVVDTAGPVPWVTLFLLGSVLLLARWMSRPKLVRLALGGAVGALLFAAATSIAIAGSAKTPLFLGNGCLPPCPHTTVDNHVDWTTGRRWATLTTVTPNQPTTTQDVVIEPYAGVRLLFPVALFGAGLGEALAVAAFRGRRTTGATSGG